jgi:ABC-type branched-subunit amino acid transport system ATPase component/ABC-type branched-subunit amino acid transport system permease subunit
VIVLGMITGITYGLFSAGLVIVYRTNRVINFAHGETGAFGAAMFALITLRWHVPYYVAVPIALAIGGAVGAASELAVVRRLRTAPRLMSIVATLGVAQFLVAFARTINSEGLSGYTFPEPPGLPVLNVGALRITPAYVGTLIFGPIVVAGLALFLRRSRFGLALRGAAANSEAARMAGISASRMSTLAWALAGALSTFTALLVIPEIGLATGTSFGPELLLRGLLCAVLARMSSLPAALVSGLGLGVVEGVLLRNYPSGGLVEVILFVIILVALLLQSRETGRVTERGSAWAAVLPWRPPPEALRDSFVVRNLGSIIAVLVLVVLGLLTPLISNANAVTIASIVAFATVALSVGIVTGLGGQLSLGQFALGSIGAVASYQVSKRTGGNPVLSLVYGGLAAAAASLLIGLPALRIRGMFLTVTTLGLSLVVPAWLLQQPWAFGSRAEPGRPEVFGHSLTTGRSYYVFVLVVFAVMLVLARNVRRTSLGRLMVAVRDNEDNARAFTLSARRIKLQGFLLSGFIAGVGGALYSHLFTSVESATFQSRYSIALVVMSVVGGIGLLAGPLLGVAFVQAVPAFVPLDTAGIFVTNLGLLVVILYFPRGIVQGVAPLRRRVFAAIAARRGIDLDEALGVPPPVDITGTHVSAVVLPAVERAGRTVLERTEPLLEAIDVHKRFGGLAAVGGVSLHLQQGEILGLLGPNGAGKTTLFEVLAGFTRADGGKVRFAGRDVTPLSPEQRGRMGLIRSFQDAGLFPTMTVLETVELAMERALPTQFFASVVGLGGRDRQKAALARELVATLGLWSWRNAQIQELSTGTRRITEIACLIALQPRVLLLDEPSSGIAQRESEALGSLLSDLRSQLGITLLVIEHDIPLIMGIADRIVVMDAGQVIASGDPSVVREDPAVVEAYLGGSIDAIERSGSPPAVTAGRAAADAAPAGRSGR